MSKPIYYDIRTDLEKYPDAWLYLVWSKRGPGKTYSTLRMMVEDHIKFVYIKRTIEDVNMLCSGLQKYNKDVDFSPFVPLNRDFGWNIKTISIDRGGLAAFYNCTISEEDGLPVPYGEPLGYVIAATAATKFKGFDMSDCDYMIYDEFIPRKWERVNRREGDQILDLYLTISRDRLKRGKSELKLIGLANATDISNPFFYTMDLIDNAAEMQIKNIEYQYDEYKGIMLHKISADFDKDTEQKKSGIERAMEGTQFGEMAFGGSFGYNDFSAVKRMQMKGMKPVTRFNYRRKHYYIYMKEGQYYVTKSAHSSGYEYNIDSETEQKRFYYDYVLDIRNEAIDGKVAFETYTMYDLIMNYTKIFKIN